MTRNRYYSGSVSDHFDGSRFFVPNVPPPDKSLGELWRFRRTPSAPWPKHVDAPPPAPLLQCVAGSDLRVTSIGHASHLIQTRGLNILLDPVWSERASPFGFVGPKRVAAPGIPLDDLPPIDAILISHSHYDHLDLATLDRLHARGPCRIVVPLGNDTIIRRHNPSIPVEAYDWEQTAALARDVTVTLLPSYHWSARWLNDRRMALWAAFLIATPDGPLYCIGDTGYRRGEIFLDVPRRFGRPRLAIIPIGAYEPRWFMRDQHVDPVEAVRIFGDCGAHHALAHHWGCFKLTTEAIGDPPTRLASALAAASIDPSLFRVQRPGEAFDVPAIADLRAGDT